jgi:hypothetical protein
MHSGSLVQSKKSQLGVKNGYQGQITTTSPASDPVVIYRVTTEPSISVEIEALLTLLYMLVISHEDDEEFMDELGECLILGHELYPRWTLF